MSASRLWRRLPLPWRLHAFRLLESMAALRSGVPSLRGNADLPVATDRSLWVFVSTIGELNAIEPFLNRLLEELQQPELTLISDRAHYRAAYLAKYPRAVVATLGGSTAEVQELIARRPPLMLLVAEIPCQLHDAPCRFSFAAVQAVRRAGAPLVLVNGWLYGYRPPSRLDAIENGFFAADYVAAYDLMLVQSEAIRTHLVDAGADPARVVATGNIKFDAMAPALAAPSPLGEALRQRRRGPVIVAGSVTETQDQRSIIEAFRRVLDAMPDALLVLAPRHPENVERMAALHVLLKDAALGYRMRSEHAPTAAVAGPVLVIDTMGELRSCYAEATLAFVGTDHNVLEPLAFGKPVFVVGGWDPTFPSYPVYRALLDAGGLHAVDSLDDVGAAWLKRLGNSQEGIALEDSRVQAVLQQARGAVDRCFVAMRSCSALQGVGLSTLPLSDARH